MAQTLTTNFRLTLGLDGASEKAGAAAFVKPQVGAIYVEWLRTGVAIEKPIPMIRAILDKLRQEPKKAALGGDGKQIEELEYKELKSGEVVEAKLGWRHKENETLTVSRTLIWQNKEKILRVVRASCVFAESDRDKIQRVCQGSLVSLTSDEIDKGELLALGVIPGAASQAPRQPADVESGDATRPGTAGPTMGTPSSGVLYADANAKPTKSKTGRWIFVIGALLIVFAIYSLTRSRSGGGRSEDATDRDDDEPDDDEPDDDEPDDDEPDDDEPDEPDDDEPDDDEPDDAGPSPTEEEE